MQFLALILSITLHVGLVAGMFLWPSGSNIKEENTPVFISLVEGDFGGNNAPSSILGAAGKPAEKIAPTLPSKELTPPPAPIQKEVPQVPKEVHAAEPVKKVEQSLPEPKPLPKPEPKEEPKVEAPKPKPEPKKPEPKPEPKVEPKKSEPKKEDKKPAPKKTEPKKTEPKKTETKKTTPKKETSTAKKPAKKPEKLTPAQEIARAMAEAKKNAGGFGGGDAGQGEGAGGTDVSDAYIAQVTLAVQNNWDYETATRDNYVSKVKVQVTLSGKVLSADIYVSSGNVQFDASTVNAVLRTDRENEFPAPPDKKHQTLILNFDPKMLQ